MRFHFSRHHDPFSHHHHDHNHTHHGQRGGGRHAGHHGFGHFFRHGEGSEGFGPRDFRSGRKLSGDSLQLLILAMLDEKPRHGYEIIKELGERTGGFYTPSPGMVYPALTYLEETGHARVEAEGAKKLYLITEQGKAHLAEHRAEADALLKQLGWLADKMAGVRRFFGRGDDSDAEPGDDHGARHHDRRGSPELHAARHDLRNAFVERMKDASPEEERRIIEILKRAAAAIRGGDDAA
jgi:DNA-binding PadR family transcriptional regulator